MFFLLFILHLHFLSTFFHLALVPFIFVSFRSFLSPLPLQTHNTTTSFFAMFLLFVFPFNVLRSSILLFSMSFLLFLSSPFPLYFFSSISSPCSPSSLVLPAWLSAFISCYLQSWPKFLERPRNNSRASRYISLLTQVRKFSVPPSPLSNV